MTQTAIEAPPATRREWLGLAVLALPTLLSAMDFSVLFLALLAVILLRHPHPAAEAPGAATRPSDLRPSDLCPSDLCPSR
jgi:hypothetical protein